VPETYGVPDPAPTKVERVEAATTRIVAGQGIVRRVVLYVLIAAFAISPLPAIAVLPLILLCVTDPALA
jgi:hypothetical protein